MTDTTSHQHTDILFEQRQALGLITLNRPKALNALTRDMCLAMTNRLRAWATDSAIRAVAITGAGDKAFCAGGDIRALYETGRRAPDQAMLFYRDEYRLNTLIKEYPKPYVALIDGIAMGGGVGVSVHGSHRIVSENTLFAMPETGIGLFPDVGGSYFLPRLRGGDLALGLYLGLTGARLKAADTLFAGIATHFIPRQRHGEFLAALSAGEDITAACETLSSPPGPPPLDAELAAIHRHFSAAGVEAILDSLRAEATDWTAKTADILETKSPTSLKVTFRQLQEGAHLSFRDCMRMEYRLTRHFIEGHDFYEGVRAVVIDKDQAPRWRPAHLADVSDETVGAYFAPLGADELSFH